MDGTSDGVRALQHRLTQLNNALDRVTSNNDAARLVAEIEDIERQLDAAEQAVRWD